MSQLTDDARKVANDLNGPDWVNATFAARDRLTTLANHVDRLELLMIAILDAWRSPPVTDVLPDTERTPTPSWVHSPR